MTHINPSAKRTRPDFPDIYIILFGFIVLVSALTWIIPAGSFDRTELPNGRTTVVPDSYRIIERSPVGLMDVVTAIPDGLTDASSIVFLVLLVGGAVGVVRRTGVIDLGIRSLIKLMGTRVEMLIPTLMGGMAIIAAFIGTPELSLAYLPIILPLMLRLGYDTVTATAVVLLSTTLGFAFGISVPATIGIGHMLSGLPMFSGALYRSLFFLLIQALSAFFVLRYARKVKTDPQRALNVEEDQKLLKDLVKDDNIQTFTQRQRVAAISALTMFIAFVAAVLKFGLGFEEISGLFVAMAVITSILAGHSLNHICQNFNIAFKESSWGL